MKFCQKCGETKLLDDFYSKKQSPDGRASECKECAKARSRAWNAANRERKARQGRVWAAANADKKKAQDRAYYQANKGRAIARAKMWAVANPERVRDIQGKFHALNPAAKRAYTKKYEALHPDVRRTILTRYRARMAAAPGGDFTADEWRRMKELYEGHCAYCHRDDVKLTQDHIVAISKGGAHTAANIAPACLPCNSSKGDRDLIEWLTWRIERGKAQMARVA